MSTVSLLVGITCASFVCKLNLHLERCQHHWVAEVRGKVLVYLLPLSLQKAALLAFSRAASLQLPQELYFPQASAILVTVDRLFLPKVRGFPQSLLAPFQSKLTSPASFLLLTIASFSPSQTILDFQLYISLAILPSSPLSVGHVPCTDL